MKILALTSNPEKYAEYQEHFALYGIKSSLSRGDDLSKGEILAWLEGVAEDGPGSIAFREQADLYEDEAGSTPLMRPYRSKTFNGKVVHNVARLSIYRLGDNGTLIEETHHAAIRGTLRDAERAPSPHSFDWDDVFVPDESDLSLHEAKASPGKLSARSLVLDRLIRDYLPFRSNRVFKYGKLSPSGVVDLNWWPISPDAPIQFDLLPWDFLISNEDLAVPELQDHCVGRMLRSALADGAHFRAASSRREWLYWAPGINAGIPLTPKEDAAAELIYLSHDFAHYALPDLIVDTEADLRIDQAIIAHRMIGETLAMVTADMFVMDAMVRAGIQTDADKHGIHPLYKEMHLDGLSDREAFLSVFRGAVQALLLGSDAGLRDLTGSSEAADRKIEIFMRKYQKFALADFEWTHLNLKELHRKQERATRWIGLMPEGLLSKLRLQASSQLAQRLGGRLTEAQGFENVLWVCFDDIVAHDILPRMTPAPTPSRDEVLTRSAQRYFLGQLALYARYPEAARTSLALPEIQALLTKPSVSVEDIRRLRDIYERDLDAMQAAHRITPLDRDVYRSVFSIVRPHYVSYANPTYTTHASVFALFE